MKAVAITNIFKPMARFVVIRKFIKKKTIKLWFLKQIFRIYLILILSITYKNNLKQKWIFVKCEQYLLHHWSYVFIKEDNLIVNNCLQECPNGEIAEENVISKMI